MEILEKPCLRVGTVARAASVRARAFLAVLVICQGLAAAPKPQGAARPISHPNRELVNARRHVLGARPLGMYYYSADNRGLQSLPSHASQMTLLAPQCFWLDDQGFVHGEIPASVMDIARRARLPVMPLLVNPKFDQPLASALLRNPRAQKRAAMYLAYLARRDNYVGWQLDLEHVDPADKGRYSRFVAEVAARLHRDNRLLSVAVVPRFSDAYPDRSTKEFRTGEWGAPYDYRALGRVVDFLTLMTYEHHGESDPPGPVAGYEWVKEAVHYAIARVPRSKLLLGIPFYGREWVSQGQTETTRSLAFQDAQELLGRPGTEFRWDDRWRTRWFQYRDASGEHTGWYEDSESLGAKLQLMRQYQLRGFAAWRLGVEDPKFWTLPAFAPRSERDARTANSQRRQPKPQDRVPARATSRSR